MLRLACLSLGIAIAMAGTAQAGHGGHYVYIPVLIPRGPGKEITCSKVPVEKILAGTKWEMYGCDERMIDFKAAKDNPLYPYFFIVRPDVIGWDVYGAPISDSAPAAPRDEAKIKEVRTELEKLDGDSVDALLAESTAAQSSPTSNPNN
jgi:hypothetical protein